MGDLIYVLPTIIIFFFIIFRILSLFKRGFDFVRKNFDLTIEQAGEEIKRDNNKMNAGYDQSEVESRIAEAEKKSIAASKERILNQKKTKDSDQKKQKRIKENDLSQQKNKRKNSSLGEIFSQYSELEKAVIYNEILSKPKALKRD
jgi:hypothetical protein